MSFDLQLRTSYIFVKYIYTVHHVEDFSRYFPIDHGGRGGGAGNRFLLIQHSRAQTDRLME